MDTPTSPRIQRRVALRAGLVTILLFLAAIVGSGCSGIVMEPTADTQTTGPMPFSGYAMAAGDTLFLQAQATSGAWETIQTFTASARPTYVGGVTGYYWQITANPTTVAARFKRPTSTPHQAVVFMRVQSQNSRFPQAETHSGNSQNPSPVADTLLEMIWGEYRTSDSIIRVRIPN
jgi:hypothetical protein